MRTEESSSSFRTVGRPCPLAACSTACRGECRGVVQKRQKASPKWVMGLDGICFGRWMMFHLFWMSAHQRPPNLQLAPSEVRTIIIPCCKSSLTHPGPNLVLKTSVSGICFDDVLLCFPRAPVVPPQVRSDCEVATGTAKQK